MDNIIRKTLRENIAQFKLPEYDEITDVGLFLEQTVRLINGYLEPLGGIELTSSMVSNYVKQKLIAAPVKKQYDRERIAYLIYMAIAKSVLSLEDIRCLFEFQQETYPAETAYNYFCAEFDNVLQYTFGNKDKLEAVGVTNTITKDLLRNMILTVSNKIYLSKYLEEVKRTGQR